LRTSGGDSNGAVVVGSRHRRLDCYGHSHSIDGKVHSVEYAEYARKWWMGVVEGAMDE
jgi:hypothetical protein